MMRSDSIAAAADALAERVHAALDAAVDARGTASLLVPGGRTPVAFFHALRRRQLRWPRVHVGLTDERWVAPDHPDSNARLVRGELLVGMAADARFTLLQTGAATAEQGAADSWRLVSALPRPFDAVVLGMGDDGHFASLFPASPGLHAALDPGAAPGCVAMRAPSAPTDRISLNLAALASARQLFVFITGQHKLDLIEAAPRRHALPIDALLAVRQPQPVMYWAP